MTPTHEQYTLALRQIAYHEKMAEQAKQIARAYLYAQEAQRVKDKKADSERYYNSLTRPIR